MSAWERMATSPAPPGSCATMFGAGTNALVRPEITTRMGGVWAATALSSDPPLHPAPKGSALAGQSTRGPSVINVSQGSLEQNAKRVDALSRAPMEAPARRLAIASARRGLQASSVSLVPLDTLEQIAKIMRFLHPIEP